MEVGVNDGFISCMLSDPPVNRQEIKTPPPSFFRAGGRMRVVVVWAGPACHAWHLRLLLGAFGAPSLASLLRLRLARIRVGFCS